MRSGATHALKMAHLAEWRGTRIELHSPGMLFGLIHATLGCCIDNTTFIEFMRGAQGTALREQGERYGMLSALLIGDGSIAPPDLPGWGAEWDMDRFNSLVVEEL